MKNNPLTKARGFTLIELLVVILIFGFVVVALVVILNIVRMNDRDAVRVENIAAINRAMALYLEDSRTGYPPSTGECLGEVSGVGAELKAKQLLSGVPVDPLWSTVAPTHANGVPVADQIDFCYFYFSDDSSQFKVSFFLEANSRAGKAGINIRAQ